MDILVINCGSSSLKYQLIDMDKEEWISKGVCESYTPDMISQVGVQIFRIITLIFNKNIRNIFNNNEKKKLKRVD